MQKRKKLTTSDTTKIGPEEQYNRTVISENFGDIGLLYSVVF